MNKPVPPDLIKFPPDYIDLSKRADKNALGEIYLVMEHGDDYHGSRPVCYCVSQAAAKKKAEDLRSKQVPCQECDHTYSYCVYDVPNGDTNA